MFLKKTYAAVLLLCCFWLLPVAEAQAAEIKIFVDNVPAFSEVSPYYSNDSLLVPVRLISEELGASVVWTDSRVQITGENVDIVMQVGQKQAMVNGQSQTLAAAPQMKQGRLFVPLRFIGESLSAKVSYRDGKIFLYTPLYDDSRAASGIFPRGDLIYTYQDGKIYLGKAGAEKTDTIVERPYVRGLAAVSNSGLLFSSNDGGQYYSLKDGDVSAYNIGWTDLYNATPFTDMGKYFYTDLAESRESKPYVAINDVKVPVEQRTSYSAIFSADIDGTNKKEVFVEENYYGFARLTYYDGWLYYQRRIPVAKDWGYDTYAGPVCRVPAAGGQRQELTPERIGGWFVDAEGLHYRTLADDLVLLPFANMQK